jgi:hypothetical protein
LWKQLSDLLHNSNQTSPPAAVASQDIDNQATAGAVAAAATLAQGGQEKALELRAPADVYAWVSLALQLTFGGSKAGAARTSAANSTWLRFSNIQCSWHMGLQQGATETVNMPQAVAAGSGSGNGREWSTHLLHLAQQLDVQADLELLQRQLQALHGDQQQQQQQQQGLAGTAVEVLEWIEAVQEQALEAAAQAVAAAALAAGEAAAVVTGDGSDASLPLADVVCSICHNCSSHVMAATGSCKAASCQLLAVKALAAAACKDGCVGGIGIGAGCQGSGSLSRVVEAAAVQLPRALQQLMQAVFCRDCTCQAAASYGKAAAVCLAARRAVRHAHLALHMYCIGLK